MHPTAARRISRMLVPEVEEVVAMLGTRSLFPEMDCEARSLLTWERGWMSDAGSGPGAGKNV
jgi:hypothetical protein